MILLLPIGMAACLASCTAAFGPGYSIERQEIHVQFEPAPRPKIHVDSASQLRNTGNQPMSVLALRLPARRFFHVENSLVTWDETPLSGTASPANPRDTVFDLPQKWSVSERHTLHYSAEFLPPAAGETGFAFTSRAFFLPSEGWTPQLLPARGLFASGGVPPQQWRLSVRVPRGFLVHVSGRSAKISRNNNEVIVQSLQTPNDDYPFVIAGAYRETSLESSAAKVILWTHSQMQAAEFHASVEAMTRVIRAYDTTFGSTVKGSMPLWIVECPILPGCFSAQNSPYAEYLGAQSGTQSAELASDDTLMMDFSGGPPKLAAAAPALAATWLGYGRNPGFYNQRAPLSALPAFATSLGREAALGPPARDEAIRRALKEVPKTTGSAKQADANVLRAKSFLFFYGLQERYGPEVFRRAMDHMLSARRGRGFNLDDLIAAFEQETHQNVAEFVRLWMKHPGVPDEFRMHYEGASAALATTSKENKP